MTESTQIIGNKQFVHAKKLMDEAKEQISGAIDYRHSFIDMSNINVTRADGSFAKTCSPSMG
jgi:neutral ceramidase